MIKEYIVIKDWKRVWKNPLSDGTYKLIKETRSIKINNYYWVCIQVIVDEYANYGYIHTLDEIHEICKKWLLPRIRVYSENKKNYVYQRQSTTNLKDKEMSQYLNRIKIIAEFWKLHTMWLEEISGFIIPDPEDRNLFNYIDKQWQQQ